jgi:plastocyanin
VIRRGALLATVVAVASLGVAPSLAAPQRGVAVKDDFFKPSSLTIVKGTKVVWTWKGQGRHNVVVGQGPSQFRSDIKRQGTYSHTFKKTGTWHLVCTVHPGMNMKVVAKKPQ